MSCLTPHYRALTENSSVCAVGRIAGRRATPSTGLVAGIAGLNLGRGARFFLVAGVMSWGGARMETALREYIDRIGWLVVALAVLVFLLVEV